MRHELLDAARRVAAQRGAGRCRPIRAPFTDRRTSPAMQPRSSGPTAASSAESYPVPIDRPMRQVARGRAARVLPRHHGSRVRADDVPRARSWRRCRACSALGAPSSSYESLQETDHALERLRLILILVSLGGRRNRCGAGRGWSRARPSLRCGASPRLPSESPRRASRASACRRAGTTSSRRSAARSTRCSARSRSPSRRSGASSPTPRTSCARR